MKISEHWGASDHFAGSGFVYSEISVDEYFSYNRTYEWALSALRPTFRVGFEDTISRTAIVRSPNASNLLFEASSADTIIVLDKRWYEYVCLFFEISDRFMLSLLNHDKEAEVESKALSRGLSSIIAMESLCNQHQNLRMISEIYRKNKFYIDRLRNYAFSRKKDNLKSRFSVAMASILAPWAAVYHELGHIEPALIDPNRVDETGKVLKFAETEFLRINQPLRHDYAIGPRSNIDFDCIQALNFVSKNKNSLDELTADINMLKYTTSFSELFSEEFILFNFSARSNYYSWFCNMLCSITHITCWISEIRFLTRVNFGSRLIKSAKVSSFYSESISRRSLSHLFSTYFVESQNWEFFSDIDIMRDHRNFIWQFNFNEWAAYRELIEPQKKAYLFETFPVNSFDDRQFSTIDEALVATGYNIS